MTEQKVTRKMSKAKVLKLFEQLRLTFPRLEAAVDTASWDHYGDSWTREDPAPWSDDDEGKALEAAWAETYAVVQTLEAGGHPATYSQSEAECDDVCGFSFVGHVDCAIRFGGHLFEEWTHDIAYETLQGAAHTEFEADDQPDIPPILFVRLGFERDLWGMPQDDEQAVAWARDAGIELDEDIYGEEEQEEEDEAEDAEAKEDGVLNA